MSEQVQQGAHIVRVHDVQEMRDATLLADAIYPRG
jgi:dihydropteroate synthase